MQLAAQLALIEIFAQNAAAKRREIRLVELAERAFEDRKHKEKQEKEERERLEETIMATAEQVGAFRDRLDGYDIAVVHALMDNERALDAARQRREAMEASAYRLPDGRRAFKTEDGTRVFDQHGAELPHDVVDPPTIPDSLPRWEKFKAEKETEQGLIQERQKLHEFQKHLDDARDTLGKGPVSANTLSEMDAALQRDMPDSVKARLPGAMAKPDADATSAERAPKLGAYKGAASYLNGIVSGP